MGKKIAILFLLMGSLLGQAIIASDDELFLHYQTCEALEKNELWRLWILYETGGHAQALKDVEVYINSLDNQSLEMLAIEFKNCPVVPEKISRTQYIDALYKSEFINKVAQFTNGTEFRRRLRGLVAMYSGLYTRLKAAYDFYEEFLTYFFRNFAEFSLEQTLQDIVFEQNLYPQALIKFQRLHKADPDDVRIQKLKEISNRHLRLFDTKSVDAAYKSMNFFLESQFWASWSALYDDTLSTEEKMDKRSFAKEFFEGDHQLTFIAANFYAIVSQHTYLFDKKEFIKEVENETFFAAFLGPKKAQTFKKLLTAPLGMEQTSKRQAKFEFSKRECKNYEARTKYLAQMINSLSTKMGQEILNGFEAFTHFSQQDLLELKQALQAALATDEDVFYLTYKYKNIELSLYAWLLLTKQLPQCSDEAKDRTYDELLSFFSRREKLALFLNYNHETNTFDVVVHAKDGSKRSLRRDIFLAHLKISKEHFNEVYSRFNGNKLKSDLELVYELKQQIEEAPAETKVPNKTPISSTNKNEKKLREQLNRQVKGQKAAERKQAYWEKKKTKNTLPPPFIDIEPEKTATRQPKNTKPGKTPKKTRKKNAGKKPVKKATQKQTGKTPVPIESEAQPEKSEELVHNSPQAIFEQAPFLPCGNENRIDYLYDGVLLPEQIKLIKQIEYRRIGLDQEYYRVVAEFEKLRVEHHQSTDALEEKNISVLDAIHLRVSLVGKISHEQRTTMTQAQEDLCSKNSRLAKNMMLLQNAMPVSKDTIQQKIAEAQQSFGLLKHQLEQECHEVEMRIKNARVYIQQLQESFERLKP